jgi:hypothetical protein
MPPLSELPNVDCRLPISRNSFPGFLLSWEILTEAKIPDVDLAIAIGCFSNQISAA